VPLSPLTISAFTLPALKSADAASMRGRKNILALPSANRADVPKTTATGISGTAFTSFTHLPSATAAMRHSEPKIKPTPSAANMASHSLQRFQFIFMRHFSAHFTQPSIP
jgi:hypothetical protein